MAGEAMGSAYPDEPSLSASPSRTSSASGSPAAMAAAGGAAADDDEGDICRICRLPGDARRPLRQPCACRGSIKFVHDDCLLRWLGIRRDKRCEVCKHEISVSNVYSPNAPARLPLSEFMLGLSKKAIGWLLVLLSVVFALVVWEFVMPLTTIWTCRLALARSFGEARQLFLRGLSIDSFFADALHGLMLVPSSSTIFLCVSIRRMFLREHGRLRELNGVIRIAADVIAPFALWVARLEARLQQRFGLLDILQVHALHTVEAALMVVAGDAILACFFAFLPFSVGRIVLHCISSLNVGNAVKIDDSQVSTASILYLGYKAIFLVIILCSALLSLRQYVRGEHVTIGMLFELLTIKMSWIFGQLPFGRFPGMDAVVQSVVCLSRQLFRGVVHLVAVVKVSLIVIILLGIRPLFLGWLLDVCTSKLFGATISQKLELLIFSSFASTSLHWLIGFMFLLLHAEFVSLLRQVLEKGVIHFHIPVDQNKCLSCEIINEPWHRCAFLLVSTLSVNCLSIAMVILLPVEILTRIVPTFFPLDIIIFEPSPTSPTFLPPPKNYANLVCGAILLKFLICKALKNLKPSELLVKVIWHWFVAIGGALGLMDFLVASPEEASEPEIENNGAAKKDGVSDDVQYKKKFFGLRTVLLLVLAWLTLVLFNCALIIGPISVGRALFGTIPPHPIAHGFKSNDLFAFAVGFCVMWCVLAASAYSFDYMTTGRTHLLICSICNCVRNALKSSPLLLIWIVIIPLLIGLLLDLLVIVPIRVPVNESPVFDLYYDWSLGLILLDLWTKLVNWTRIVPCLALLVDESWQRKLTRAREEGFSELRAIWVLREILIPITIKLLTALCVPYVLAKGIFPVFGYSLVVNSAVYRFAWLGALLFRVHCYCAKRLCRVLMKLRDSMRDERYIIGRRLQNYHDNSEDRLI